MMNGKFYKLPNFQHVYSYSSTSYNYCICIRLVLFADVVAGPCENGWRYFPVTNACYKLMEDELPWSAAEFKCLFQGAHHASIENAAENQFVNG
ncbi:hypothetical protein DICVIV_11469 [Dictyocaulus viviparus]|uniref:C-type lectin domain-containing protein n=1 Tax=Dictyocaulus viviparus TaxID=29172 RepID=A0A0D8XD38_DICVI|nr:hypothetical protein DICVIV_11469 [Dictyocaulus viviparus]